MEASFLDLLSEVLPNYGLKGPYNLSDLSGGTANRNWILEQGNAKYVLRERNLKYSDPEWIRYEAEYLSHIHSKGIPVPVLIPSRSGDCFYKTGDKTYQLMTYLEGGRFSCDTEYKIEQAAVFLAMLHNSLNGFKPSSRKELPRYDDPEKISKEISNCMINDKPIITDDDIKALNYILYQTQTAHKRLTDDEYWGLPLTVIHGDYHPANIKERENRICGIFDFDWISRQPRIRDVVDGMIYFASMREDISGGDIFSLAKGYILNKRGIRIFIEAYNKAVRNKLNDDELRYIPDFMRFRLIYSRIQALPKIRSEQRVGMLTDGVTQMLDWIDENKDVLSSVKSVCV